MEAVLLGLASAAAFSCADFFGGVAARRTGAWMSVLANQTIGIIPLAVYLVLLTDHGPTGRDIGLSALAGLASVVGLTLLFGAFAVGRMAVVAPVSAGVGGIIPIVWGILQGERPSPLALVGAAIAMSAAVVLARTEAPASDAAAVGESLDTGAMPTDDTKASLMAVGAGVAFGLILIAFSETSEDSGLWPPMIAHFVAIPTVALVVIIRGGAQVPPRSIWRVMVASGFFDATAIALLVVALNQDLVSLVAPAANLYPAGTVLLAAFLLGERLQRIQVAALAAAAIGLVLLAGG